MQTNASLGGKSVVVGLNWTVISKDNPAKKRDIKKACDEAGFSHGVIVDGLGKVAAVGLCPKKGENPSAAALLAAANREKLKGVGFGDDQTNASWIVVEKLRSGDKAGSYWLCGITDGVPVPGTDIIEDLTTISGKLAELLEILEDVDIYSPDAEIQEYVRDASPAIDMGFADLTSSIAAPKGYRPQKVQGVPESAYLALGGIVLLLGAGIGYTMYADMQEKEMMAKRAQAAKMQAAQNALLQKAEADAAYGKESDARKMAEIGKLKASLSFSPEVMAKAWGETIGKIPLDHGGWKVMLVSCDQTQCEVLLDRDEFIGTNESLMDIIPGATVLDEKRASYRMELAVEPKDPDMEGLSTWDAFAKEGVSRLQELRLAGVTGKIGPKQAVSFTPPPVPGEYGQAGVTPPPRPLGYETGNLSLTGNGAWQIDSLADVLRQKEFALERLEVNFGGNLTSQAAWRITGKYILRTSGAAPIAGAVAAPSAAVPMGTPPAPGEGPTPPANQPVPVAPAGNPQ